MPRAPRVKLDNNEQKRSNEHIKLREENTPAYLSQEFTPPPTLTREEREIWDWLVKVFRATINCRVSDADVHLMELYCRAKVAADKAAEELRKDPRPYVIVPLGKDKNGNVKTTAKPNPHRKILKENSELCLKLFEQLGLSPLARAKAGLAAANAKVDKEEELLKQIMQRTDD
jgi:P27 family predicted phage terminase small subunit